MAPACYRASAPHTSNMYFMSVMCVLRSQAFGETKDQAFASHWPHAKSFSPPPPPPRRHCPLSRFPGHGCGLSKCMLRNQSKSSLSLTAQFIGKYCPIYLHTGPKRSHRPPLVGHLPADLSQEPPSWSPVSSTVPSTAYSPPSSRSNLSKSKSKHVHFHGGNISASRPKSYNDLSGPKGAAPLTPDRPSSSFSLLPSGPLAFPETPGMLLPLHLLSLACDTPPREPHAPSPPPSSAGQSVQMLPSGWDLP